ncbi:hypothetical protein V495_07207 [Pseudogymnoascus sp. VKM F-4514 (FW-929)]|nr:hypothetical protein V495_07207 [Pseudogymnoascus sp. VKM F-4514 (FW-929)]
MADNPFATSAPSPSSGDGMDGMDGMDMSHGSSGMGSMGSMTMTFQNNPSTPLFGTGWTPTGTGSYAGTCIFLIILAVLFRVLLALKARQEARWLHRLDPLRNRLLRWHLHLPHHPRGPLPSPPRSQSAPRSTLARRRIAPPICCSSGEAGAERDGCGA